MTRQEEFFATKVVPIASKIEQWRPHLVSLLDKMNTTTSTQWTSQPFLEALWSSEAVSNTGLGTVSLDIALEDASFRQMFGPRADQARQLGGQQQIDALKHLLDDTYVAFNALGMPRMPRLKTNRVLAALAPERLTTLANPGTREQMYKWATGKSHRGVHAIDQHVAIREAFDALAGPYPQLQDPANLTAFMLPWLAFEELEKERKSARKSAESPRANSPNPTNAAPPSPSRAFIAVGGGLRRLIEICDIAASAPLSEEDLYECLQERYPWNHAWAKQVAQFMTNGLGVLAREDATYQISPLGEALLEKRSGKVLAERLVHHFAGVDHLLVALRDGPQPKSDLIALLRRINPSTRTNFVANTTLAWMAALDVMVLSKGECSLTPDGYEWATLVKWTPGSTVVDEGAITDSAETVAVEMDVPKWHQVKTRFAAASQVDRMNFPEQKVFELHTGLWSQPVRHFCVLKGLSGAGKTQMAVRYARAVIEAAGEDESCLEIIPVQPDWSEPAHLLGYTHPMEPTRYQSTQFLKILLRAHDNPTAPHFAILDEMNLAHPELYFAPILSTMETESELWLHQSTDISAHGIPGSIRYPRNLAIIGTINIDETTHNLSDKVKDRAEIIDFSEVRIADFDWSNFAHLGEKVDIIRNVLTLLHDALLPVRLHFAFRVVSAIVNRVAFAIDQQGGEASIDWLPYFDDAVASKILPKFRGEESKALRLAMDSVSTILSEARLTRSAREVDALRQQLAHEGILKYWR